MKKRIHVAVVFNEPTVETEDGRKYISENGRLEAMASHSHVVGNVPKAAVDLSEMGVLEERENVEKVLQLCGYKTSLFNVNGDIKRLIAFLEEKQPDLIFNLCESVGNESIHEMHVAGIYELLGVPYTGAGAYTLGTCLNKARTKEILSFHRIATPRFAVYKSISELSIDDLELNFPLIVKPAFEDASVGIENASVVENVAALRKRIRFILQNFDQPALVEEYIEGRELNVAIIGNKRPIVLPISEIDFSTLPEGYPRIVTYNAKWVEGTDEFAGTKGVCPADVPPEIERKAKEIALKAYRIMGLRDYGRIDMRLDKKGQLFVLEVNPNPDISDSAGFARSARAYGLTPTEAINRIVEYALERTP
ncbi:MAG TPA: ATP-grasp domain-containing protein [Bacteroidota bacterium]